MDNTPISNKGFSHSGTVVEAQGGGPTRMVVLFEARDPAESVTVTLTMYGPKPA